jgi:membrane-associated phospholipid phosphatase
MNLNRRWFILNIVLFVIAVIISLLARWFPVFPGDIGLSHLVQSIINPPLTLIMSAVAALFTGYPAALMLAAAGILVVWRIGILEGIMVWLSGIIILLNDLIKIAIDRPRPSPEQVQIIGINHSSGFPSGHTFFATLFLGILAYILFTRLKKRKLKILSLILLILLNLAVAFSRIYLGAHWLSDVLGGYIVGGLFLTLLLWVFELAVSRLASRNHNI